MNLKTVIVALVALAAIGCAKRESRVEQGATDSTSARADSVRAARIPPLVEGHAVGTSDSLINAIAPSLGPWITMWRHAMPEFAPDSLIRVGSAPALRGGYVQPLKKVYPPRSESEPAFLILSASSPDRRYLLIFDSYLVIQETAGEIDVSGEPDSAPLLLDLRRKTSNQFETCGTVCRFDWGVWLSPTRFALAGTQDADASGKWKQGRLKIYSIPEGTSVTYVTRPVSIENYGEYRYEWEEWVCAKYRALKNPHPHS